MEDKNNIELEFIDHVAIRVTDFDISIAWYSKVLGLKKLKLEKWGDYPVFMMSNKFGVALFPAEGDGRENVIGDKRVKIDHFAFNVNRQNFEKAIKKYTALGLKFEIKDHHYFDSIYTNDPDGHVVELTTIKVDEDDFYKKS